jgi:photosystem II stability/assembly factor-like uncharacterized protein
MAVSQAGDRRLVMVGEHGIVLLSDNGGRSFRQARSVPVQAALTAVHFVDPDYGWSVGQWGTIIATRDGGETWQLQRVDTTVDQPLFSVFFRDRNTGWAVGLWSLFLKTADGGKTWRRIRLQKPPAGGDADRNLYDIFPGSGGSLFLAAEQGTVLRSTDEGETWTYLNTGYSGSFWAGVVSRNGMVFVGGLRGSLFCSSDQGASWTRVNSRMASSITSLIDENGQLMGSGLDGRWFIGPDSGAGSFRAHQLNARSALTGIALTGADKLAFSSKDGPVVLK